MHSKCIIVSRVVLQLLLCFCIMYLAHSAFMYKVITIFLATLIHLIKTRLFTEELDKKKISLS